MKSTKQIVGVGLLTLVGTSFAMAQTPTTSISTLNWNNSKAGIQRMFDGKEGKGKKIGHEKRSQKHANKQAVHDAIIAGDFAKFQALASATPIGKIDINVFNSLSAQMKIMQAAKTQVDTILKNAGVERPFHMGGMHN
jgi:hypothetical protein